MCIRDRLTAPINMTDDLETVNKKLQLVSRYLETFLVFRSVNYRTLSYSSIRYAMFSLIKDIRDKNVGDLRDIFKAKIGAFEKKLEDFRDLRLHGMNKRFIHFLLARITRHIEEKCGIASNFVDYVNSDLSKPFQIEHIWSDKIALHQNEFSDSTEFEEFRNKIGALLLIQQGTNQSYNADVYESKLPFYFGQNLLAKSLSPRCYEKNPNFLNYVQASHLPFKPHEHFTRSDVMDRQKLYQKICEEIWSIDGFDRIVNA